MDKTYRDLILGMGEKTIVCAFERLAHTRWTGYLKVYGYKSQNQFLRKAKA